jgi:hypothetical protein
MSFVDTALAYIRFSTGEITFDFFKTKKGNNISTLAARDEDQRANKLNLRCVT